MFVCLGRSFQSSAAMADVVSMKAREKGLGLKQKGSLDMYAAR